MDAAIPLSKQTLPAPPLEAHLRRLIERHGPLTVAEYMAICLGHPDHGYYQTRDPFGRDGDFTTAPEISQMFGEIVGAWCIDEWRRMGGMPFALVEFGPGRGTLMADILRVAARLAPDFAAAASLHLVETSPALIERQQKRLAAYRPSWHAGVEDVPEGPSIFVMNEFLDALPVRQFVVTEAGLCERRVGLDGERFAFVVERTAKAPRAPSLAVGSIVETCPAAIAIVRELSRRIADRDGRALIIDYGYEAAAGSDSFQAVRNHAYADPLVGPGETDLTAHVDFGALAAAAKAAGIAVDGPMGQGGFLRANGIEHRARKLAEAGDGQAMGALRRLTDPAEMGELFRVLALRPA